MTYFLDLFLEQNPGLDTVLRAEKQDQDVLLWAHKKKYVHLKKAPTGELCYSKEDLEAAKMWRVKDGS